MHAMIRGMQPRPVATVAEAEAYAQEVTSRIYGPEAARLQLPYRAEVADEGWRVTGSRRWGGFAELYTQEGSGPITLVFGRDGVVLNVYFTTTGQVAPFPHPPAEHSATGNAQQQAPDR